MATEITWEKVSGFRETPHLWIFQASGFMIALPKRTVTADQIAEVGDFLRTTL